MIVKILLLTSSGRPSSQRETGQDPIEEKLKRITDNDENNYSCILLHLWQRRPGRRLRWPGARALDPPLLTSASNVYFFLESPT